MTNHPELKACPTILCSDCQQLKKCKCAGCCSNCTRPSPIIPEDAIQPVTDDALLHEMACAYEEERAKYLGGITKYNANGDAFIGCMKKALITHALKGQSK